MERAELEKCTYINRAVPKKDAMALVTGQAVYMDDIVSQNCLTVKVLRSPHAQELMMYLL